MEVLTTSSKYLLQRITANHNIAASSEEANMIDWMGQAMRFIGKHAGIEKKYCINVYVEDYHTCYPYGTEGILAIVYKGKLLPLGSDLSGVNYDRRLKRTSNSNDYIADYDLITLINGFKQQQLTLIDQYAITPTQEIAELINELSGKILANETYIASLNRNQYSGKGLEGEFYNLKRNAIQTSFESGYVDILHTCFPVDEEGYPLIIDNEFYIQAIEWYLITMLIQKGYAHPIFTYWDAYYMFWGGNPKTPNDLGWRAKAANNVRIPSIQEAERFTRMWEQVRFRRDLPKILFDRTEQLQGLLY